MRVDGETAGNKQGKKKRNAVTSLVKRAHGRSPVLDCFYRCTAEVSGIIRYVSLN
jgi:hypothetical protein